MWSSGRPSRTCAQVKLEAGSRASLLAAVDLGGRFGEQAFGYRLNVAQERLRPLVRNLDGERSLVALATDWRVTHDSVLEGEFEWSHKSQPSQVGFSLLGNTLPAPGRSAPEPEQPALVASLGLRRHHGHRCVSRRRSLATGAGRRNWARSGSRTTTAPRFRSAAAPRATSIAFARTGLSTSTISAARTRGAGRTRLRSISRANSPPAASAHDLSLGLLAGKLRNRFQPQAFNLVGTGNVEGTASFPTPTRLRPRCTDRDERSARTLAADAIRWNERLTTWLGLRHTRLRSRLLPVAQYAMVAVS